MFGTSVQFEEVTYIHCFVDVLVCPLLRPSSRPSLPPPSHPFITDASTLLWLSLDSALIITALCRCQRRQNTEP